MADGGKTPVTRGGSKASNASKSTNTVEAPTTEATVKVGGASGQEQVNGGSVQRPRSKSPTKYAVLSSDTTAIRSNVVRSSPRASGSKRASQGISMFAASNTNAATYRTTSPPNSLHAPGPQNVTQLSNSVPATPHVHARRYSNEHRTPSPISGTIQTDGNISPRSVRSDSDSRVRPSQRNLVPVPCRFETGLAASRRRIPYSLGGDMLERAAGPVKERLSEEEEKKLTAEMDKLYKEQLLPTQESEDRRAEFMAKLEKIINERWPGNNIKVHVFGSSGNLLCTSESDVDICITAPPNVIGRMCNLAHCLASKGMERVVCIPQAKVPIVKIWDPEFKLACDMNINNTAAIENTRMIRTYVTIDPRVRPLAMVVKHWTRRRILNDAALGGTLSSYTWISLLIHFLQSRKPPILPSLQQRPHQCTVHENGKRSSFADDVESLSTYGKSNKESIGELLFGFFRCYAHEFDYEGKVISIRAGKLLLKTEKRWHLSVNNRLCVEEPFNTDRNLGNTADDISFRGLHLELRRAFDLLCEAKLDECCEQFEFPQEQERIWQKPAPQPLPILTRSRSQTNRSSRSSEGGGGRNNPKGRHSKGGSGRRASSAAASNKNNLVFTTPVHQGQWFAEGGQISGQMIHEQLSQHMSMLQQQEAYYKLQQQHMAIAQSHAQSVVQVPQIQTGSRQAPSMRDNPRRSSAIEPGPLSAPLRNLQSTYAFPFPPTPRSGSTTPAANHSKQMSTTATNPSSPSLGMGRLAPMDPRRHSQRPMTPEASDMARSRSQPPGSSRDGQAPLPEQMQGRYYYPAQVGGALAGYPGLQHYQQQYLQAKERHSKLSHQSSQSQSQDQQEPGRIRLDSSRLDGHEGDEREREKVISNPEFPGYHVEGLSPSQQVAALQAHAHATSPTPYEQRTERLFSPSMQRLRTQQRERTSRSPSPSTSSFGRDRSYSIQSGRSSVGQPSQASRQGISLPVSLTSPSMAGGPIIIDGSGDSPSDGQASHSSRPSSIYDSASSEITATEHEQRAEEVFGQTLGEAYLARSVGTDEKSGGAAYSNFQAPHGPIHFGELPMNPGQLSYLNREHFTRPQRMTNFPEQTNTSIFSASTVPDRESSTQRSNGLITGLGIDVESTLSSDNNVEEKQEGEACQDTPKVSQNDVQEKGSAPNAFHQQLPQGMANGSAVKQGLTNPLKPAPLLSPVREVRTPSPTTNRTRSSLSAQVSNKEETKSRVSKEDKESKKVGQHTRAFSLLSEEALRARDVDTSIVTKRPSPKISYSSEGYSLDHEQSSSRGGEQVSEAQAQVHTPVSPMPLSYSAMARKSSQTHSEQHQPPPKPGQYRSHTDRHESDSISPRTQSPTGGPNGAGNDSSYSSGKSEDSVSLASTNTRTGKTRVRSNDNQSISSSTTQNNSRDSVVSTQQRQLRAQQIRALADSVPRINYSGAHGSSYQDLSSDKKAQSTTRRNSSYIQSIKGPSTEHSRAPTGASQSQEAALSQQGTAGSGSSSTGSMSSGWQQASKRRNKKSSQAPSNGSMNMHRRQINSIGGMPPRELGEDKGG